MPSAQKYNVYSAGGKAYAATLNQANIGNNNNKFYILQILENEANTSPKFIFFTRWGRIGVPGQQASIPCDTADGAIWQYTAKLRDKLRGGYREVEMNYEDDGKGNNNEDKDEKKEKKKDTD